MRYKSQYMFLKARTLPETSQHHRMIDTEKESSIRCWQQSWLQCSLQRRAHLGARVGALLTGQLCWKCLQEVPAGEALEQILLSKLQ